ncbi:methyltransferase domain-containing protein [Candidatus Woesearchaeota archaeon]|nr:methyltransferase domain-containing protein [Candidatus Woesearchaeota archaeon]
MSEQNKKQCEVCNKEIPQDFTNLLCYECYDIQVQEIEQKKQEEIETKAIDEPAGKAAENLENAGSGEQASTLTNINNLQLLSVDSSTLSPSTYNVNGITNSNYEENPEMEDKEQVAANLRLFEKNGVLLWHPTRTIYEFIKNHCIKKATSHPQYPKFIWKPTIVDVGCGSGVGSNILSQEADFVWGIDKNKQSIKFAKEAFTRVKNGIYYNSQVSFDEWDIINDNRETMKFDIVVAIEIIEHIYDYKTFLKQITKFDTKNPNNPTEYFISTPNRNNKHIDQKRPFNKFHCREYTAQEFHAVLSEFFKDMEFFSSAGESAPIDTNHTPLLCKCVAK